MFSFQIFKIQIYLAITPENPQNQNRIKRYLKFGGKCLRKNPKTELFDQKIIW